MNKMIVVSIIVAGLLVGVAVAYMVNQQQNNVAPTETLEDKKLPGDSQTEQVIDNTLSGKPLMDGGNLPDTKPKANDIQGSGSDNTMRGDVIIEGKSDL